MISIADSREAAAGRGLELARVLLVESDVASRLTLQTLLRAGGYTVDVAASAAEAIGKLDESAYELVLTDSHMESSGAGRSMFDYARGKCYKPATAVIRKHGEGNECEGREDSCDQLLGGG